MISYLKGKVLKKSEKDLILVIDNVGYTIHLSKSLLPGVKENSEVEFFIHQQFREDASELYGFETYEELNFFKTLISVKGIGPKVALEIIATPIDQINEAILNEDIAKISKIPGIGKKTAQRIILELKGELTPGSLDRETRSISREIESEVEDALSKLGYQRRQITLVIEKAPKELQTTEELINFFLRNV